MRGTAKPGTSVGGVPSPRRSLRGVGAPRLQWHGLKRGWHWTLIFFLSLLPLLPLPAGRAQTPAPVQAIRFSVFSARPVTDVAYVPRANAAPVALKFHPTARSARYEYRGPLPLRFVDPDTGVVVAEANLSAEIHDPLLLFSPADPAAGAGKLRYTVAVLDDGATRHGPGGLAIINLSGLALSGTVNDRAVTLKPGLNPTIPVGRAAKIRFTTVFKQRSYQSYVGAATLGRNERALLILFPPFYKGALEVQSRLLLDQPPGGAVARPK